MGFELNDEQRVRIGLSKRAALIIESDMIVFHVDKKNTFINTVFEHFYEHASVSLQQSLQNISDSVYSDELSSPRPSHLSGYSDKELEAIQSWSLHQTRWDIQKRIDRYKHLPVDDGGRFTCRINNHNSRILASSPESDTYKGKLVLYLRCILEEYAEKPYKEREHIYFQDSYQTVENAITGSYQLQIITGDLKGFDVKPFRFAEDALSTFTYLVGYSKPSQAESASWQVSSFRISRCKEIRPKMHRKARLSKAEVSFIEEELQKREVPFLVDCEEEIRVRLTQEGVKKYQGQLFLRPRKDSALSHGNEYVFHCTQRQAEYYFFKFGHDAEILAPLSLRERFAQMYADAASRYTGT